MKHHYLALMLLLATVAQAQAEMSGFPVTYTRSSGTSDILHEHGPVVANVDSDANLEIIVFSDSSPNDGKADEILVYDPTSPNSPEYTFTMPTALVNSGFTFSHCPAVLDGDGDGQMEIAVSAWVRQDYGSGQCPLSAFSTCHHDNASCTHYTSRLLVFEIGNPNVTTITSLYTKLTTPSVGDVTGDGLDDIVLVGKEYDGQINDGIPTGNGWANAIAVASWNGQNWSSSSHTFAHCDPDVSYLQKLVDESSVALGDMDGDGIQEIVALLPDVDASAGEAELIIIDEDESPPTVTEITLDDKYVLNAGGSGGHSGPILGDIDHDGVLDVAFVILDNSGALGSAQLAIYNGDDETFQYVDIPNDYLYSGRDEIAMCDGHTTSDRLDIYVPTRSGTTTRMHWLTWNQFGLPEFANSLNWPKSFDATLSTAGAGYAPTIGSTNASGALEFVSQIGAGTNNYFRMLKLDNTQGNDVSIDITDDYVTDYTYLSSPVVADVNGDGDLELIATADAGSQSGRIHAYELNIDTDPQSAEWNGLRNGAKHTGRYAQPVPYMQDVTNVSWSGRISVSASGYYVPDGYNLVIEPGTVVEFDEYADLWIEGSLTAVGTHSEPIIFASRVPDTRWNGLIVSYGSVVLNYANFKDFKDYGIYTDTPSSVSINHTDFDCSSLRLGGVGLLLWNSPTVSQVVKNSFVHSVAPDSQCAGMYLYNCKVDFDTVTIEDCDWVNSYIKKVTGSFYGCTFRDRVDYYSIYFNSTPNTPNFRCCTFEDLAPSSGTWPTTIYCASGTMPSFGAEGTTFSGVSNVITDFSNSLMTMNGSVNLPIVDSNPQYQIETNGGHNDWIQENSGGRFLIRNSPGTTTYPCTEQYWSPDAQVGMFDPQNGGTTYWNYSSPMDDPWTLCGGGGGIEQSVGDGPLARNNGNLDEDDLYETFAEALQYEQAEDYLAAQELFRYVTENASETSLRWSALAHVVICESFTQASGSWGSDLISSMIELENNYETRVLGDRLRASYFQNRGEFDSAIETCTALLSSGLTFEDSIQVATDLLGIQSSMDGHDGGSLDGMSATQMIPPSLRAESTEEVVTIERDLFSLLNPVTREGRSQKAIPGDFRLYQNYPNPFNPTTQIEFDLPETSSLTLKVFNTLGQEVATVSDGKYNAGHYVMTWNGKSNAGIDVATGLYIYQLKAGSFLDTKKMILMR